MSVTLVNYNVKLGLKPSSTVYNLLKWQCLGFRFFFSFFVEKWSEGSLTDWQLPWPEMRTLKNNISKTVGSFFLSLQCKKILWHSNNSSKEKITTPREAVSQSSKGLFKSKNEYKPSIAWIGCFGLKWCHSKLRKQAFGLTV